MVFSIVVPVYNVEKYLEECIESVINQTYSGWELILVDDGSTDHSCQICERYANKDSRIQLIKKENTGQADSRNIGVEKASGDYLLFVDSDDYIDTDTLQRLYGECLKWNSVDVIISEGMFEVYGERIGGYVHWDFREYQGISGREAVLKTMEIAPNWSPCGKCYRLSYWREHGFAFLKDRLAEDFELVDRIVLEAKLVSMIPTFYYYRKFRENSTMTRPNKKLKRDELLNLKSWEQYFKEKGIDEDAELLTAFRSTFVVSYCHEILANMYLFDKAEKKELFPEIEKYLFYLDYGKSREIKLIRRAVKCLGIRATCGMLGVLKQFRIKKVRKNALRNLED